MYSMIKKINKNQINIDKNINSKNNINIFKQTELQRYINIDDGTNIKIGFNNIQGNYQNKITHIINSCKNLKIDIMGICETNLIDTNEEINKFNNIDNEYKILLSNDENNRDSGIGLIIKKSLCNYVHKTDHYKGRIIWLDL